MAGQAAHLVIVDNCSTPLKRGQLQHIANQLGATLIKNESNLGIAGGLNRGLLFSQGKGFEWALLFDQDSRPFSNILESLSAIHVQIPDNHRVAVIGAQYLDIHRHPLSSPCALRSPSIHWREQSSVILSGSLLSLRAFSEIGPYREDFFMDLVDTEFCHRARMDRWLVIQSVHPLMYHAVGKASCHWLLWKRVWMTNHAPLRRYYMTRNGILFMREFGLLRPGWQITTLLAALKRSFYILCFEDGCTSKIHAILSGWWDGVCKRYKRPNSI